MKKPTTEHYDELTELTGMPFMVCNGSCLGAYGDHLIVSDGKEWHYSEALHESNYPAVRVEVGGVIQSSEVDDARKYWAVYLTGRGRHCGMSPIYAGAFVFVLATSRLMAATAVKYTAQYFLASSTSELWITPPNLHPNGR